MSRAHRFGSSLAVARRCSVRVLSLAALPEVRWAPPVFFAAWLAACWFNLGLVLGALTWLWIHRLTGGTWGVALRPHILRLGGAPAAGASFSAAPALRRALGSIPGSARRSMRSAGAEHAFLRLLACPGVPGRALRRLRRRLAGAGAHARGARSRAAARPPSLMLHLVVTSLASVDALVALVPGWSSSVFGLLALTGQAFGGGAAAIALACAALRRGRQPAGQRRRAAVARLRQPAADGACCSGPISPSCSC